MRKFSSYFVFILFAAPALALSFLGFKRYDDEGLFLYMAHIAQAGVLPYRDYLLEYGPLYSWANRLFFSFFGMNHFASRSAVVFLVFFTALQLFKIASRLEISKSYAMCAALSWLYVSSPYFCESLHPGWYIALIQGVQGVLLCLPTTRFLLLAQGILCGVVIGFKPHLGVLAVFALLAYYSNRSRLPGRLPRILFSGSLCCLACLLLAMILPILPRYGLSFLAVCSVAPFLSVVFIFFYLARKRWVESTEPESKAQLIEVSSVIYFISSCILVSLVTYGSASYYFGLSSIYESLFLQPSKLYYALYSTPIPYAIEELVLYGLSVFCGLIAISIPNARKSFSAAAVFLSVILCAAGTPGNVLAWGLVYLLYLPKCKSMSSARTGLLLLAASQLIHAFPLPAAQVNYATALSWVLLFDLVADKVKFLKEYFPGLLVVSRLLPFFLLLPLLRPIIWKFSDFRFDHSPCDAALFQLIQEPDYAEELCALTTFINNTSNTDQRLLTFAGFFSLNILSQRDSPAKLPAARWSYLPARHLDRVIADLVTTKYAVVHVANGRLYLEYEANAPEGFDTRLLSRVEREFEFVATKQWYDKPARYFKVLINPKLRD